MTVLFRVVSGGSSWFNAKSVEWFGVTNGPGEFQFLGANGDPLDANVTTLFTFGSVYSTREDAEAALANFVAALDLPFVAFEGITGSHLYGEVYPLWVNADHIRGLGSAAPGGGPRRVDVETDSRSVSTAQFTHLYSVETYAESNDAEDAVDALAVAVNTLYE